MTIVIAFLAGCIFWYFAGMKLARFGLRRDDVTKNLLDGLTLSELNRFRAAADREIQARIRQADEEATH